MGISIWLQAPMPDLYVSCLWYMSFPYSNLLYMISISIGNIFFIVIVNRINNTSKSNNVVDILRWFLSYHRHEHKSSARPSYYKAESRIDNMIPEFNLYHLLNFLCKSASPGTSDSLVDQAPVPLSIFRSNSKFDEKSERSSFRYTRPITTTFCTRHDSDTVVTCGKYRCHQPRIFYTRVFWIFIEFRIRSKYA